MRMLRRRFHTLIKNVSFPSPISSPADVGSQSTSFQSLASSLAHRLMFTPLLGLTSSLAYRSVSGSDTIYIVGPRRGVDCEMPHRLEKGLEKGMSVSEDVRARRGWIVKFHIG